MLEWLAVVIGFEGVRNDTTMWRLWKVDGGVQDIMVYNTNTFTGLEKE